MMTKNKMMKKFSILFIILLFIGATISVNATNDESTPIEDPKGQIKGKFIMAHIYFQAGEVKNYY